MKRLVLSSLALLYSFTSFCQTENTTASKSSLTGTIVDATTKKGVEGATVSWSQKGGAKKSGATASDAAGKFSIAITDSGTYILRITAVGFKEQTVSLTASVEGYHLGELALVSGTGTLAEVIIKTDKPLIEQKADRLVYNAEKDLSTLGGTAADVLRNVPMLSVDGNGNVQLRGSSNIRVLVNNKPSSIIAVSVADALRQLPADVVKAVEVITSPGAKYDAEGTAGIINIITKKNMLQGVTGSVLIVPGNVSTIGNAGLNFRRPKYGLNFSAGINQFYNRGRAYLERLNYSDNSIFIQDGRTKNRSGFVSPRLGFDVTLNDRNNISGGIAYNPAHNTVRNRQTLTRRAPGFADNISTLELLSRSRDIGYDANFEYLRTFKDPQKELGFLALYSITDSDNEAYQDEFGGGKEVVYQQRNLNKSQNREATFQVDFTQPLKNKTLIEMGAKTILRKASSDVDYRDIYPLSGFERTSENIFSYNQDVWAGYLSYAFKLWNKVQVKTGVRYEKTEIFADYKTRDYSFSAGYDNLIPSLNAAYTFKQKHTVRIGFTQRLQRPQLYFLNPYREVIAPQIIRQGNPELDAELADLYEIGYGTYGAKFSFNASVYARITDNAITSAINLENDTTYIRFFNIAKNKTVGGSVSSNLKPWKAVGLNANANVYYADLQGDGVSNSGWMYNFFTGLNVELGKGWSYAFTGSFNSRRVSLQGRMASFYYHNTTLRREIWNKRGTIGINLANPLMRGTRYRTELATATFEQLEDRIDYTRGVRLSFSYRFGSLQQAKAPRKPKKSISNDDALRG